MRIRNMLLERPLVLSAIVKATSGAFRREDAQSKEKQTCKRGLPLRLVRNVQRARHALPFVLIGLPLVS